MRSVGVDDGGGGGKCESVLARYEHAKPVVCVQRRMASTLQVQELQIAAEQASRREADLQNEIVALKHR